MRLLKTILISIVFLALMVLTSCGREDEEDALDLPSVTVEQLAALENMSSSIRQWAPRCGAFKIACEEDSDGDSMLWAGMLCASGEGSQCVAAMASIGSDGLVGRSPERLHSSTENSSSRDMLLGALLAILTTKNQGKAEAIVSYIENHGHRICEDATDNRCNVYPAQHLAVWGIMGKIWESIELTPTNHMKTADMGDDLAIQLQSVFSPPGYGLHLIAVELWLRRLTNTWNGKMQNAANQLVSKQPTNPFFEFVARGKTERAAELTLKYCPKARPESANQWSWQRDESEQAWFRSMGHECIFMSNVLH